MAIIKWMFRVFGIILCVSLASPGAATVHDPMVFIINGQIHAVHATVEPGNNDELMWDPPPRQQHTLSRPSNPTEPGHTPAKSEQQATFISPSRIALLAFVVAGVLAARKQSQS